jgi:hypothetical protein
MRRPLQIEAEPSNSHIQVPRRVDRDSTKGSESRVGIAAVARIDVSSHTPYRRGLRESFNRVAVHLVISTFNHLVDN